VLNVYKFGNPADVYATVHPIPRACQHITVDHVFYSCLLTANQGNCVSGPFSEKMCRVSLSIDVRITTIRCVVYLLQIFKMFQGLMNNVVYIYMELLVKPVLLTLYIYIYGPTFGNAESRLFLFAAQCFNTE
jgi:hypothetical protein